MEADTAKKEAKATAKAEADLVKKMVSGMPPGRAFHC